MKNHVEREDNKAIFFVGLNPLGSEDISDVMNDRAEFLNNDQRLITYKKPNGSIIDPMKLKEVAVDLKQKLFIDHDSKSRLNAKIDYNFSEKSDRPTALEKSRKSPSDVTVLKPLRQETEQIRRQSVWKFSDEVSNRNHEFLKKILIYFTNIRICEEYSMTASSTAQRQTNRNMIVCLKKIIQLLHFQIIPPPPTNVPLYM